MTQKISYTTAIGIDVGEKRIGVARVSAVARIPEPLVTLQNTPDFMDKLAAILEEYQADLIVVGLPRNMSGTETQQTDTVREFVSAHIAPYTKVPIVFQDETLTSVAADTYPDTVRQRVGSDAIAAAEILADYIEAR